MSKQVKSLNGKRSIYSCSSCGSVKTVVIVALPEQHFMGELNGKAYSVIRRNSRKCQGCGQVGIETTRE